MVRDVAASGLARLQALGRPEQIAREDDACDASRSRSLLYPCACRSIGWETGLRIELLDVGNVHSMEARWSRVAT